jgi:hypothetical protein
MKLPSRATVLVLILAAACIGSALLVIRQCGPGAWARSAKQVIADAKGAFAEERKFEPRVMIHTVQGSGTLIVHTVHFDFADPETKFARRTGKVTAAADIEYAVDVSHVTESDFTKIDREHGTFALKLAPPRPHKPRVESVEYAEIHRDGFLGYTLGLFSTEQRFKDEAGVAVQKEFDKRLNDPEDLALARKMTVDILNDLYRPSGWKCEVEWQEAP